MSSAIDPPRRSGPVRQPPKAARRKDKDDATAAEPANLPVPVGEAETIAPAQPVDPTAAVTAQLLGQKGARRGLRAGPAAIDKANAAYNQAQWSGKKDRRAPKGRNAKTDV